MNETMPKPTSNLLILLGKILGWVLTACVVAMLSLSASMKFKKDDQVVKGFKDFGYDEKVIVPIGVAEIVSTVLYAIPQTSVLGAILVTGYLGGAINTHVRVNQDFTFAVILGVVAWAALFLRDARIRSILPIKM